MDTGCYGTERMQNKALNGLAYEICEIYIDDVLIHGKSEAEFLRDVRISLSTPSKPSLVSQQTKLGHLVFATGTSFTPEKRLKVLDFPQPTTQKEMLQFIGLAKW